MQALFGRIFGIFEKRSPPPSRIEERVQRVYNLNQYIIRRDNMSTNNNQGYMPANNQVYIPPEYQPISMWGYFGYQILFAIPFIGFIFLIIFACGGKKNVNVKNFARSYFCVLIIWVVIIAIVLAIVAATGSASYLSQIAQQTK